METTELRKKVIAFANLADERALRVVYAVFENYEDTNEYELPEVAEKLIQQAMEESDQGLVRLHNEVIADFKNRYISK
ncbi:hypothetical protein [Aequorivita capsosiphonis]|uniref:hypothetical protein n=1 Tax=Aequorivita capsosiphonis TaxID=487317 RepID=UPI000423B91B|nr:hypothetical protein [Aequorivita capsosiphonis]